MTLRALGVPTTLPELAPHERLIVALDLPDAAAARILAARLAPQVGAVKVGLELVNAAGPAIIEQLAADGARVFYDAKFHDIPNTVAGAVRQAARRGAWMLNVHASGGGAML
ncbi:MAG: orotidine 5'-phosphate decarboxylase, partial [Armatimonadetes bacterium]|nr:orotidine 5'-phosphate decarboxylase [Armatimonadota bacterium]